MVIHKFCSSATTTAGVVAAAIPAGDVLVPRIPAPAFFTLNEEARWSSVVRTYPATSPPCSRPIAADVAWARIETSFPRNPKVVALKALGRMGRDALLLHVEVLCYCREQFTDGNVFRSSARTLSYGFPRAAQLIKLLVQHRLWDETADGWQVHDYLEYNPSATQIRTSMKADAERKRRERGSRVPQDVRADVLADVPSDGRPESGRSSPKSEVRSPEKQHLHHGASSMPQRGIQGLDGFDRFWAVYPKKIGKGAARAAWRKAAPANGLAERIVAAVERQRHEPQWLRDDGRFIPNPATWINQTRWEDGEPSARQERSYGE